MGLGINLKGLLNQIGQPLPSLREDCQSLDPNVWAITNPLTGTAWAVQVVGGSGGGRFFKTILNASENAALIGKYQFPPVDRPNIYKKVIFECVLNLGAAANVAKIDGVNSGWGLIDQATGDGGNFTVDNNGNLVIQSGLYNVTVGNSQLFGGGWGLGSIQKFKIEASWKYTRFFVNDVLVQDVRLPNVAGLVAEVAPVFDFYTLPAGGATIYVGHNRLWYKDNLS